MIRRASAGPYLLALLVLWACTACRNRHPWRNAKTDGVYAVRHAVDAGDGSIASDAGTPRLAALADENGAFERELVGDSDNPEVGVFPVGERAIVTIGATAVGYVERGGPLVDDLASFKGLPQTKGRAIAFMLGDSPRWLVAVVGKYGGSGNPGNHHAYVRRGSIWTNINPGGAGWDAPTSVAWDANSLWLFVPEPFYLINGTLLRGKYPCTGSHRLKVEHIGFDGAPKKRPMVDADFFPREVVANEKGSAFVWGWSACRPGLFLGMLQDKSVALEPVPGSDACTERAGSNGLPALQAKAFPASNGGIYVVTYPQSVEDKDSGEPCQRTTLYHRQPTGAWSARSLTLDGAAWASLYVAPEGVLWVASARSSVLALSGDGDVAEYPLGATCARSLDIKHDAETETFELDSVRPITQFVAASPGDIWAVANYGDRIKGLCRLCRGRSRPPLRQ